MNYSLSLLDEYRSLFPILQSKVHLAACSQGALSIHVKQATEKYVHSLMMEGTNWSEAIQNVEESKRKFAQLIGAEIDEIAVMTSVSDAISAIATSLSYDEGKNRIFTTDMDFPTVGHIWLAQRQNGAEIHFLPTKEDTIYPEHYERYLDGNTLLTSIADVSYYNGFKQDIAQISKIVHEKGSLLLIDAYQSAGHYPLHVKEMNIDILVTGTRKYLLGIPGIAFLYVKKELAETLTPRITGWLGQEALASLDLHNLCYGAGTRRFETGTPSFISAYAASSALDLFLDIGVERISEHCRKLADFTVSYGVEKGLRPAGSLSSKQRGIMTAFYIDKAQEVEKSLRTKGILVSSRKDVIRMAPHFYNTTSDIEQAINEICKIQ
ncbi:aminotransferase class V-fold PLP-dependent enzyme [Siminovitchia terrae]|uniref:aminotransferase class V-fold PLP-dependent enzyme n=1 Tax=Siminovitchia terrae TaxID=1914933 RepID=UPI001FE2A1CB|nr:aminotransferase class V-fold PLP-dependent enzyme [Siminovitchia terrae]